MPVTEDGVQLFVELMIENHRHLSRGEDPRGAQNSDTGKSIEILENQGSGRDAHVHDQSGEARNSLEDCANIIHLKSPKPPSMSRFRSAVHRQGRGCASRDAMPNAKHPEGTGS